METISDIFNKISNEVANQPALKELQPQIDDAQTLLNDLNSGSKVANWRLWKWVFAVAHFVHKGMWNLFKSEVDAIVETSRVGSLPWWQQIALEFQYGHSLEFIENKYQYATIDVDAQIIKRSAAIESGQQVIMKVAKVDGDDPVKLDTTELDAFKSYVEKKRPPGVNVLASSIDADLLKLSYDIYYNPALMNASGQLLSDTSVKPVEVALLAYIENIIWDGAFNIQKATDAIQAATGVVDVVSNTQYIKPYAGDYRAISREEKSTAGYMIIDPTFLLSAQINYIANV